MQLCQPTSSNAAELPDPALGLSRQTGEEVLQIGEGLMPVDRRLDAPLTHPAPQLVGVDAIGQGDAGNRGARSVAGFDQGSLEGFCVGTTDRRGLVTFM